MNPNDPYNYFPTLVIGGPTGDYNVICPVPDCRWAEYALVAISNGDGGSGSIVVSGNKAPIALPYDGSKTLSGEIYQYGHAYRLAQGSSLDLHDYWERITDSQKRFFARIDAAANTSIYISVKFRAMPVAVVPAPPMATIHPDHGHQMNIEREKNTLERLRKMQVPMTSYIVDEFGRRIPAPQDEGNQSNGRR